MTGNHNSNQPTGLPSTTVPVPVTRVITALIGIVVALTFIFGFGNVLNLAINLGVPIWVAPLIAPAVDLSIVALLLALHHYAACGIDDKQILSARRLLVVCSAGTLGLNTAEPLLNGQFGKAMFDAVGPLLLIGWSEVGPTLIRLLYANNATTTAPHCPDQSADAAGDRFLAHLGGNDVEHFTKSTSLMSPSRDVLFDHAQSLDSAHRASQQRPISAESLRQHLRIGSARARRLVSDLRNEFSLAE